MKRTDDVLALLRQPSRCYLATTMADGSPQLTQTWVDTDGEHIVINSVEGYLKVQNIARDPRVAVAIADPNNPSRYYHVRGRVIKMTTAGGAEHIEMLAHKYLGTPYPWYGGRDQVRVLLVIAPEKMSRAWARLRQALCDGGVHSTHQASSNSTHHRVPVHTRRGYVHATPQPAFTWWSRPYGRHYVGM